jgi:putative mRNA 3-end processing factor
MTSITFHGGAGEVGRQAIFIKLNNESFLFDYGVNVQKMEAPIPLKSLPDAVFLSHSHLDHSGFIPNLYATGYKNNVYATKTAFELSDLLLRDSYKVQNKKGLEPHYEPYDVDTVKKLGINLGYKRPVRMKESTVTFFDAGHIPGSASMLLECNGKSILYTGDIKFTDTALMKKADIDIKDVDVLICESTYSHQNHPDRKKLTDELRQHIQKIVYSGGIALLPSFAVGRTQEMLCILHDLGIPIFLDGMGIRATRIIISNPKSVKEPNKLKKAFNKARKIRREIQRADVLNEPCLVIATAGMLTGGPINYYLRKLYNRSDCALILTGYQIEGTPGRILLETGKLVYEDMDVKPDMQINFMDFSAHCSRDTLLDFIKKVNPKKILPVHGERTKEFAQELREMGFDARAPVNGERVEV